MLMNKKTLLAACVAAALPAAAGAQTRIYGTMDLWAGQKKTNAGSTSVVNSGGFTTSYWGLGGSEDLGGGLKGLYAIEGFLRADSGASGRFDGDTYFSRSAYVGLGGDFGTLTLGRNTAPYFLSTIIFNPFGDSFTFSPMVFHTFIGTEGGYDQVNGDTGLSNSVRYQSPSFNGFKVDAAYSLGAENFVAPKGAGRDLDFSAYYFGGPLSVTLAYRSLNQDTAVTPAKQTSVQFGGTYDLKLVKLFGQYQTSKSEASGPEQTAKTYQLGASVPAGGGSVLASIASTKYEASGGALLSLGDKRTNWSLGYDYLLSKRTDIYVAYMDQTYKNVTGTDPNPKNQTLGVGLRHAF
jgi:predicted porin